MKSALTIVLLAICINALSSSPELRFNHFDLSDGLSDIKVTCMVQDDRGYLWIGTRDGLNRYDGHRFEVYRSGDGGLTGNNISILQKDSEGLLWIGTHDGGLCSLDPVTRRFKAYPVQMQIPTTTNKVMSLEVKDPKYIHVGFEKSGEVRIERATGQFISSNDTAIHWVNTSYSLLFNNQGDRLYYGTSQSGLSWYDLTGEEFENHEEAFLDFHTIEAIYEDENGLIWCGAWDNALHKFDPISQEFVSYTLDGGELRFNGNEVNTLTEDQQGRIWLGTRYEGVFLFDKKTEKFTHLEDHSEDAGSVRGSNIRQIYRDAQNRMWVASEQGLSVYDPLLNQFSVNRMTGFEKDRVNAFLQKGDTLIIGHEGGLSLEIEGKREDFPLKHAGKTLNVRTLYQTRSGRLLLGTDKSMYEWDFDKERIESCVNIAQPFHDYYYDIPASFVSSIVEFERDQTDYLLSFFYGYDLLISTENYPYNSPNHVGRGQHYENLMRGLKVDSHGRLWGIGASKGVIEITDPFLTDSITKGDKILDGGKTWRYNLHATSYLKKGSTDYTLTCPDVTELIEKKDGTFWVLTNGGGLFSFDPDDTEVTFTNVNSPINAIGNGAVDSSGQLWMSTSRGLLRYSPSSEKYRLFSVQDGIPSTGLSGNVFVDNKGMVYAGGRGFYLCFDPNGLRENEAVESNYLDALWLHDQPLRVEDGLVLKHKQNFLSFGFSSPNLTDPNSNEYAYKIEGLDEVWRYVSSGTRVDYNSIPSGEFELWVRAANNDGFWNAPSRLWSFTISSPWWRTWWFYVLLVCTVFGAFYALYRYRLGQMKRLYAIRNEIARDLHDDLGSSLGSISIYSEVAKKNLLQTSEASKVIDIIGSTSRDMMDRVGDIVWAVNPKNDSIGHMINRMRNYAAPLCHIREITFKMITDPGAGKVKLSMEQRKNIFLIFKESVHNTLKYADCLNVTVTLEKQGKSVHLTIIDDGVGFDTNHVNAYNGNGVINMKTRAEAIGGRFYIESKPSEGCTVALHFEL